MNEILLISSIALWGVVLFNLVVTLAVIRQLNNPSSRRRPNLLRVGQAPPTFVAKSLDGQPVTLADYRHTDLALLFVSAHCKPCREEIPLLDALAPRAKQLGIEMVLVSISMEEETKRLVEDLSIRLPTIVAPKDSNTFMDDYKVPATPFYCFISSGKVKATGFIDAEWKESLSYARGVAWFAGPGSAPPRYKPGTERHPVGVGR